MRRRIASRATGAVLLSMIAGATVLPAGMATASAKLVYVNCTVSRQPLGSGIVHHALRRPAACELQALPEDLANLARLTGLKWAGWDTSEAFAKGSLHANHGRYVNGVLHFEVIPAEVRVFRIRSGCGGRLYYTREHVKTRFGSTNGVLSASC